MDAFERKQQNADMANLDNLLGAVRSGAMVIQAKIAEAATLRANWVSRVAAGTYPQGDLDALDTLKGDLVALKGAVDTYLT